eukprot:483980_1
MADSLSDVQQNTLFAEFSSNIKIETWGQIMKLIRDHQNHTLLTKEQLQEILPSLKQPKINALWNDFKALDDQQGDHHHVLKRTTITQWINNKYITSIPSSTSFMDDVNALISDSAGSSETSVIMDSSLPEFESSKARTPSPSPNDSYDVGINAFLDVTAALCPHALKEYQYQNKHIIPCLSFTLSERTYFQTGANVAPSSPITHSLPLQWTQDLVLDPPHQ